MARAASEARRASRNARGDIMLARSQVSRRAMLAGTAASLALPSLPRRARAQSQPTVSEAAWRELGEHITGGVIRPNDPRFVRLTLPENLRYYHPPPQPAQFPLFNGSDEG